jgi:hypothetical protein
VIQKLRLKITFLAALRYLLVFSTISGFLFGITIVIVRTVFAVPGKDLLWALLILLPGTVWAVIRAIKEMPGRNAVIALFDKKNRCGGLLMAAEELNLGSWNQKLPSLSDLTLKWKAGRSFSLFTIAVLFVAGSLIVPQRYVNITPARPLNIDADVEKLQQQIDVLEEEKLVSELVAQEFDQKLEQLRDTTSGYDPVKTWEALDHLQQSIKKQAEEFTASALTQTESLTETHTLAQGLAENASELDSGLLSEAMAELSAMIQSCAAQNELLKNELGVDCLNACKQGALSDEQLKALLKALKENKGNISNCLAKLCKAGLIDPDKLKLCEKLGICDSEGLIAFLNENAGKIGMCDAVGLYCRCPGRGGINRGRADAPMTWSQGSAEEGAAFKEQVLPAASLAALKESMTLGVSIGAPSVQEAVPSSGLDVLNSSNAGGGEAVRHTILPRHQGAVKRYFERQ